MAKEKTHFGSYYPGASLVHRLDPRCKLISLLLLMVGIFAIDSYTVFAGFYFCGFLLIAASRVPFAKVLKSIRAVLIFLILTGLLNIFFTVGGKELWHWGVLTVSEEGLRRGILMILRLMALVVVSAMLTFTTTPILLSDGLESLFAPLKRFKFPVHEFAMMMTIALRFIPILMEEADKIIKAQRSRGGDLGSGSLRQRLSGMVAVIIPLFFNALKRADDLALAMEARGYAGDKGRTKLREPIWQRRDSLALGLVVLLVAAIFWLRFAAVLY